MDDSGFPRTPDRLLESFGTRARRSEVFETMMGACGPLNSGGSATIFNRGGQISFTEAVFPTVSDQRSQLM